MESLEHKGQGYGPPDTSFESDAPQIDVGTKDKTQRLMQRGFRWLAVGGAILGLSFSIQFLLFQSGDRSLIVPMYFLTSIGALCILKGMVDIIGF